MATIAQSYVLNGQRTFFFPYPTRFSGHITLSVEGAGVVDTAEYTVTGAGPAATSVSVNWPNAPADGSILTIARVVPVDRVTDFKDDQPILPRDLNAEFDNIYQILEQMG